MAKRVLVVDPYDDLRDLVAEMLQQEGYVAETVASGEAMQWLTQARDPVDLVIIDASISWERSASLALHLKDNRTPVVMMSGTPEAMQYASKNSMQLLRKPFNRAELLDAVQRGLDSGVFGQRKADDQRH